MIEPKNMLRRDLMESGVHDLAVEDWRQLVDDANSSDLTKRE